MINIQQELAFKRRKRSVVDKKSQSKMYSITLKNPIDKLISMSDKNFILVLFLMIKIFLNFF